MGKIKTPNTRQLMVAPELQQFIDVSMASALTGALQPGYTDRNRDYGFMVHGIFGCNGELQYMLAVTNGDGGDATRNVLNPLTSDNLAYSARLNWAFLKGIGYTEGALKQGTCQWYGELGVWGHYYADRYDGGHSGLRPAHGGLRPSGGRLRPGAGLRRLLLHGGGDLLRGEDSDYALPRRRVDALPRPGRLPLPGHRLGDRGSLERLRPAPSRLPVATSSPRRRSSAWRSTTT